MRLTVASKAGKSSNFPKFSAETLVNMYAEKREGVAPFVVTSSEGLVEFNTFGATTEDGIRDQILFGTSVVVVIGSALYLLTSSTLSKIDDIYNSGRVSMASNGTYVAIVTGVGNPGYLYDGSTLSTITDTDFGGAETVDSLDGYFIFSDGSNQFFINETPFGGTNYDALDFASGESNPDNILRVFVDRRELFLFGETTIEAWYNSGNADFPFERTPGAIIDKGISGPKAVTKFDNSVVWMDHNGVVRLLGGGYQSMRISTHEIEEEFDDIDAACLWSYVYRGHEFLVVDIEDVGTWVFDAASGLWHKRKTWNEENWRVRYPVFFRNTTYVGDVDTNKLYSLSGDTFDNDGELHVSEMVFPPIQNDGEKFKVSKIQLDLQQGVAGDVRLWLSNDGEVWRSAGIRSLGATGDRDARTIWRSLGQHRSLHVKFSFSDAVRRAVFAAYAEIS